MDGGRQGGGEAGKGREGGRKGVGREGGREGGRERGRNLSDIQCVQLLIEAGAYVNAQNTLTGATPLHFASDDHTGRGDAEGRLECLRLLLAAGADKDIQDVRGRKPYQYSTVPEVRVALGGPAEVEDYAEEPVAAPPAAARIQAAFGLSRCIPCPKPPK
jgi:hypothetical protein